jgi:N-acetylmuramoyl-L-alanine amidase
LSDKLQPSCPIRLPRFGAKLPLLAAVALGLALWLWPARPARSDNFVFYLPNARHLITLQTLNHTHYLPLLPTLGLLGTVEDVEEKRNSLKLAINGQRLEFRDQNVKVKLNKQDVGLDSPVLYEGGVWLVPIDFVEKVLPRLTKQLVRYRAGDQRIFIGNIQPITFATRINPILDGARLTMQFTGPVTVQTASTNGQWIVFLGDQALVPLESQIKFENPYVSAVRFDDQDGVPKLIITPGEQGLNFYPKLTDGGREFDVEVVQPTPVQTAKGGQPPPGAPAPSGAATSQGGAPAGSGITPATGAERAAALPPPPLPVVVIDAGHGGGDSGAHSRDGVTERDLVAAVAERVRAALAASGKVRTLMTRQGTADPTTDERDVMANLARPAAFVTLHAGDLGGENPTVAVYTYAAPEGTAAAPALFVPWDEAQEAHLDRSRDFAGLMVKQLQTISGLDARGPNPAPVRQLRSVAAPAVAVELGTLAPGEDAGVLNTAPFQDQVGKAVAKAITALVGGGS